MNPVSSWHNLVVGGDIAVILGGSMPIHPQNIQIDLGGAVPPGYLGIVVNLDDDPGRIPRSRRNVGSRLHEEQITGVHGDTASYQGSILR